MVLGAKTTVVARCNQTFPNDFTHVLASRASRRHNAGGYALQAERLALFNDALPSALTAAQPLPPHNTPDGAAMYHSHPSFHPNTGI